MAIVIDVIIKIHPKRIMDYNEYGSFLDGHISFVLFD